jgi:Base plate wedge protein 53
VYYFAEMPNLTYTFDPNRIKFQQLKNIFTRVDMLRSVLKNSLVYYQYPWKDGDTLENLAYKYYGDPLRHWIIVFANMIIDPYFDLPLSQNDFTNNVNLAFGSEAAAQQTLAFYQQNTTVTTSFQGQSNTQTTLQNITPTPFTFNFLTGEVIPASLPALGESLITYSAQTIAPDGSQVSTTQTLTAISVYDNLVNINEAKRNIVLIDASYAAQIEAQYQSLMSS